MKLFIKRIQSLFHYKDLLIQLILRDLKLKYRRSVLGYLWSVLSPLLIMIVMAVVFTTLFKRSIPNYPAYLLTGQLIYNFMNASTHQALNSIISNGALIRKVYVPKYIFTLSKVSSGFVDFLLSLIALFIVMIVTGVKFTPYILLIPVVVLQLFVFCVGLGLFLAQLNTFFRDVQYIYTVITTAWLYLTPIFYPIDALPDTVRKLITALNPMYFYITQFRDIALYGKLFDLDLVFMGTAAAVLALVIGLWRFAKNQDKFVLYV